MIEDSEDSGSVLNDTSSKSSESLTNGVFFINKSWDVPSHKSASISFLDEIKDDDNEMANQALLRQ